MSELRDARTLRSYEQTEPWEPEAGVVCKCSYCRCEIYEGEQYLNLGKMNYCTGCIENNMVTAEIYGLED